MRFLCVDCFSCFSVLVLIDAITNIVVPMAIPFQGIKVHPKNPTYGDLFNSAWKADVTYNIPANYTIQECSTHSTNFMCYELLSNKTDPQTYVKIKMGFHRNDFALWKLLDTCIARLFIIYLHYLYLTCLSGRTYSPF